ncbi:MAG TPA: DNA polymerase III subunit beta [Caulobacteraceae bacterium]|nr:DNA polymerase III subunit beta [Caulobacteraceae bacterium]
MKLTIERAALLKALGHVQSAVERRNTIPILSNALISASDGQIGLSTTDLDMQIADASPAQVDASGQITAPAHTLYEIVRELPEGADVTLSYTREDPRLEVRAGRARFNLPVLPAGDFPAMTADGLSDPIAIDTDDFIRLIDKTRFAVSTEETRYYLNGLYLHVVVQDGRPKLRAVATDGRRLALAEMPAPDGFSGAPGVIIPRKTVSEARRLMDDAGETVTIAVSAQKVCFGFGHATLVSKVIDGSFPRYEEVLPRENRRVVAVDNALFAAAVRRVATISNEQSRPVRLAIESGHMTLTVRNIDASQAVEELEVDYEGEPFEIGFNGRYVMDVAAQMGGDVAEFRFAETVAGGGLEPTLVLDPTDAGVQYVLVPMRT